MKNMNIIGNAVRRQLTSMFDVYQNADDLNRFKVLEAIKCLARTFVCIKYTKEILAWSDDMASDWMSDVIIDDTI